ncbi:UNVERIFIED_CONTAM: hypothetical protein RF653_17585 [Kocuria sp. CPCC 205316]|uniref:hypothetical protein n=1 Tax=Kocuria TaxID=57493 RepID=UPI0036D7F12D
MGSAKISVVAVIDLDGKHVRLVVTGPLTMDTQTALHPLIRLGRVLTPVTRVVVDLTGARITEAAAVETLIHQAQAGHTGHPAQQVRFTLPAPMTMADVEDLRRLRAGQRSWTATGTAEDQSSTVRNINTAPAHPKATPVTATVRHRIPSSSPARRTTPEDDHATATTTQPTASTQHVTIAAESTTGTVLPFRPHRHRPGMRAQPITPVAGRSTPSQIHTR